VLYLIRRCLGEAASRPRPQSLIVKTHYCNCMVNGLSVLLQRTSWVVFVKPRESEIEIVLKHPIHRDLAHTPSYVHVYVYMYIGGGIECFVCARFL